MDQFTLPCRRAPALPPIGKRVSFTSAGLTFRATATLFGALAFFACAGWQPQAQSRESPESGSFAALR